MKHGTAQAVPLAGTGDMKGVRMNNEETVRYKLFVIGAGGTGSYFLKEFSRYLGEGGPAKGITDMYIFDGDTVEEKNLARQSFTEDDIGSNKATVMADVLNAEFGTSWRSIGEYLIEKDQISSRITSKRVVTLPVIIGCVDNHACRLLIEELFKELDNVAYLDSANEFYAGESVFAYKFGGHVVSPCRSVLFPDILEADLRSRTEMSCEELNNVAPQHIVTNMLAGQVLFSEVCSLLEKKPHPGFVTFDAGEFIMDYVPYDANRAA